MSNRVHLQELILRTIVETPIIIYKKVAFLLHFCFSNVGEIGVSTPIQNVISIKNKE